MPDAEPRRVAKVGIVGAGLMARQLALLVPPPARGARRAARPDAGAGRRRDRVDRGRARELVREGASARGRRASSPRSSTAGTEWDVFAGCDLVLEAVFEELAVKKEVFAELERVVSPECVLATNTSSLSVTEMGAELEHPERVVGMHFFNPVAVLPLVELVRTPRDRRRRRSRPPGPSPRSSARPASSSGTRRRSSSTGCSAARASVVMDALDHGNTVEETDEAVLRLGLPMAPSVLLQLVGPKVANHVRHTLHDAWPDRFPLSPTLESFAEGGERSSSSTRRAASTRSTRQCSRRSPTRRATSSRTVSSPRPRTSTRASSSAPASRSGSAGSRSTSTRPACRERVVGRPLAEIGAAVTGRLTASRRL